MEEVKEASATRNSEQTTADEYYACPINKFEIVRNGVSKEYPVVLRSRSVLGG